MNRQRNSADQRSSSKLRPAAALLRLAFPDRIPSEPLGPEVVSSSVLALPIAMATRDLVTHAKRCKDMQCRHFPLSLHRYRRMRPGSIKTKAVDSIHEVLWTESEHELVKGIRQKILSKYKAAAQSIMAGDFLEGDTLNGTLEDLGPGGPQILAAVIWAGEFAGPDAEFLFRLLVPLAESNDPEPEERSAIGDSGQVQTLKGEIRRLKKDLRNATRRAERAELAKQQQQRPVAKVREELQRVQQSVDKAGEENERLRCQLQEAESAVDTFERNLHRAGTANSELRRDLRRMQDEMRDLAVERSDLARKLAMEARRAEHLKVEKNSLPRGAEAAWLFICEEEERIQVDRTISAGGNKKRAEEEWTAHRKLETAFLEAYPEYRRPRPVTIRQKQPLRLRALGGSGEVGKSCYLLELGKHKILVDCGIKPDGSDDLHPDLDQIDHVDALILTHAHTDHIGWVPALIRKFGEVDIYCSDGTAALLPVMLEDCHRHYLRKLTLQREYAKYSRNATAPQEAYDEEDVHTVPDLAISCGYDEEETLPFGGAAIRFFPAGHILGAASVLIHDQSGRRIFFSGDFSSFPQLTVPAARWPEEVEEIDLMVLESTYGDRDHGSFEQHREGLVAFVRQAIEQDGSVLLASFGLGRAQELLKLIITAQQTGDLSAAVPIHVDGMIRQINPIYRRFANFSLPIDSYNEISGEGERQHVAERAQMTPSIIVTTSGMLAGGPVVEYARRLLPDPRHRIVLTGYQDEGAPSRALREITRSVGGPRMVQVPDEYGELISFEAALPAKEVGLSSHADQRGLLEYAARFRPKHVALVHGELDSQARLRDRLLETHPDAHIACGPSELSVP
jgi:Cft2 family RNA processing exonuclease